jgi:hypothetical protein
MIDVELGADLFYRVTPQLTLALTVNTDFAEAEVDDRVVNLTRFPVFFPERRDFFLEDAGVFDFGGVRRSPRPFFSRRIGLVGGHAAGHHAGARLTGRAGDWRIGAMTVQMDPDDELGDKNLSVLRLQRDVLESSNLGIIFTNGDPAGRGQNTLIGADFNYRNNNAFGGTGRITGDLFAQATRTDTVGVDDDNTDTSAIGGRFSINRDPWDVDRVRRADRGGLRPGARVRQPARAQRVQPRRVLHLALQRGGVRRPQHPPRINGNVGSPT